MTSEEKPAQVRLCVCVIELNLLAASCCLQGEAEGGRRVRLRGKTGSDNSGAVISGGLGCDWGGGGRDGRVEMGGE